MEKTLEDTIVKDGCFVEYGIQDDLVVAGEEFGGNLQMTESAWSRRTKGVSRGAKLDCRLRNILLSAENSNGFQPQPLDYAFAS